jgi:hypothetical protein
MRDKLPMSARWIGQSPFGAGGRLRRAERLAAHVGPAGITAPNSLAFVEGGLEALDGTGLRRPQLCGGRDVGVLGEFGCAPGDVAALRAQNVRETSKGRHDE